MWRHRTYPDTATGAVSTRCAVKFQAVMRVGALSGVGRKSCLGGSNAKVRKRDQIRSPDIPGLDASNLLGCLLPSNRTFRTPCCPSKAMGYPAIQVHNDNTRPQLKAGDGSGPPDTGRTGKRVSSGKLHRGVDRTERKAVSILPPLPGHDRLGRGGCILRGFSNPSTKENDHVE